MQAASASSPSAGKSAALTSNPPESGTRALPSEAILALRGLAIALVLTLLAALAAAALASLTVGYPIGRLG